MTLLWSPHAHLSAQEWSSILQTISALGKAKKTSRISALELCSASTSPPHRLVVTGKGQIHRAKCNFPRAYLPTGKISPGFCCC